MYNYDIRFGPVLFKYTSMLNGFKTLRKERASARTRELISLNQISSKEESIHNKNTHYKRRITRTHSDNTITENLDRSI